MSGLVMRPSFELRTLVEGDMKKKYGELMKLKMPLRSFQKFRKDIVALTVDFL